LQEALSQLEQAADKIEEVLDHSLCKDGGFNPAIDEDYISKMTPQGDENNEELIRYIQDMIGMMTTENEEVNQQNLVLLTDELYLNLTQ
jgi:hypothetical protein